jgi:hypothetical protein
MGIPNCQHVVADLAAKFPEEWRKAHNPSGGGPETEAFIRRLAWVLHSTVDARFGLNGKRGNPNDLSDDAINWIGDGPGHDPLTGRPVTVIDVIGGAGGPNPTPQWTVFDTLPGPGAWVKPEPVGEAPPSTPPTSEVWTPRHEALRGRLGTLATTLVVAQQLAHSFPDEKWGQKRAGVGREVSSDTIARKMPDGRLYGVRVRPSLKLWGLLDPGQVLEPVAPVNHVGDPVTPVDPVPVDPVDPPVTPPADLDLVLDALSALSMQVADLHETVKEQRQEVLDAVRGQSYEIDANVRMLGPVRGTITPKRQE